MADVFVSYANTDHDRVARLVAALEDMDLSVWWDGRLRGGSQFAYEIENQIKQAKAVIVVWSQSSCMSRWVADEAELGLRYNKLVPIRIDHTEPPMGFRQIHTLDLSDWRDDADSPTLANLKETVSATIYNTQTEDPTPSTNTAPAPKNSIAVLPFVNMSSDPEQEYFSDGISEELLNLLSKINQMRVTARASTFQFKNKNQDVRNIARMLKVAHILEGSVRKSGNRIRITAQLIEANSGYHLWSETYDRTLDDIFEIQDEISAAIVEELKTKILDGTEVIPPKSERSANIDAYEYFLLGQQLVNKRTKEGIERGLQEFEKSLAYDPNFVPSLIGVIDCNLLLSDHITCYGSFSVEESRAKAWPYLLKAKELEPENADVFASHALYELVAENNDAVKGHAEKAIALNANHAAAYRIYGYALSALNGSTHEIVPTLQKSLEVDPLSLATLISLANEYKYRGRYQDADALRQRCQTIDPNWPGVLNGKASDAYTRGQLKEALSVFSDHEILVTTPVGRSNFQLILTRLGHGQAVEHLDEYTALTMYCVYGFKDDAARLGPKLIAEHKSEIDYYTALTFVDWLSRIDRYKEAIALLQKFAKPNHGSTGPLFSPDSDYYGAMYMYFLAEKLGDKETAEIYLQNLREIHQDLISDPNGISIRAFMVGALIASAEGDIEACCDQIEQELDRNRSDTAFNHSPFFEEFESHPRFEALMKRAQTSLKAEIVAAQQDGLLPPPRTLLNQA